MSDLIDRQAAIDAICKACSMEGDYHKCDGYPETSTWCDELVALRALPSAQPERLTDYSFEESCTECPAYDTENHRCPRFNQVIRTALKDANLEPCEDCISRQAAIDTLDVGTELLRRVLDNADVVGVEREKFEWGLGLIESYISDMKELPSAQPEPQWIPVSEGLPKKDGRYQVTRHDDVTNTEFIDILWYEKNIWWNRQATGDYAVTAWMPLPKPYRAERREDG